MYSEGPGYFDVLVSFQSKPILRRFSEDIMAGRSQDGEEFPSERPSLGGNESSLSYSARQHLRRLQQEKIKYFESPVGVDSRDDEEWKLRMEQHGHRGSHRPDRHAWKSSHTQVKFSQN